MKLNKLSKIIVSAGLLFSLTACSTNQNENTTKDTSIAGKVQDNLNPNSNTENNVTSKIKDSFNKAKDKVNGVINESEDNQKENDSNTQEQNVNAGSYEETATELRTKVYESGTDPVVDVNGNQSTLNISDWTNSHIEYSDLDSLNRVGPATAYLDKSNVGPSKGRPGQTWLPTGWQKQEVRVGNSKKRIYDRGHLIAYTISFNLNDDGVATEGLKGSINNPKNLFSQTVYSNQTLFQRYEDPIREALKADKKVIYRVQPIFVGDELVARGAWIQAISDDGSVNFNKYVYNVQSDMTIDYSTGKATADTSFTVPK